VLSRIAFWMSVCTTSKTRINSDAQMSLEIQILQIAIFQGCMDPRPQGSKVMPMFLRWM